MRKASSVMKKTLIPGSTSAGKPSSSISTSASLTGIADAQQPSDAAHDESTTSGKSTSEKQAGRRISRKSLGKSTASGQSAPPPEGAGPDPTAASSTVEQKIDFPILPSTSTFTLSGKEDKNEKLKKKAKNFLDERQKIKSRAQSLWSYIDATNTFDQARFFQENAEQVFHVVYETCMYHIDKIKQKNERPQSWSSKELVALQKNLLLLRKIFLYVPELMRNGWQRKNIAQILSHILDHGNHLRLRALGFHLLLLWLNDQVVEYPECMELFANAIPLDLFVLDEIQPYSNTAANFAHDVSGLPEERETATNKLHAGGLHFVKKLSERHTEKSFGHGLNRDEKIKKAKLNLHQTLILGDDSAPLYPNPCQPTFYDSIVLLHIFIANLVRLANVAAGSPPPPDDYDYPPGDNTEADDGIATGVGIDAATASAKFLFRIFRTYYLTKFTPHIARLLEVEGVPTDKNEEFGFPRCPPSILRTLLRFLIGYCLDNNEGHQAANCPRLPFTSISAPAIPILKSIVLSSHETREMLHEILRQALILPCTNPQYRDITRGAIHILGVWMLGNEEERPSFLRRTGSWTGVTRSSSMASVPTPKTQESKVDTQSKKDTPTSPTSPFDEHDYKHADANRFLRRYFLMIKLVFEDHDDHVPNDQVNTIDMQQNADWESLVHLYKDAINVYRAITVTRGGIDMELESWELLLRCLLDIQAWLMNEPDKYSRIPVQSLAEDLADYVWETLLHAFVRAKIAHLELWKELNKHMISSMRWTETLRQWVKIMQKLTRVLSAKLYKVEYDTQLSERLSRDGHGCPTFPHQQSSMATPCRGRSKVRSRHLSMHGESRGSNRTAGRPLSAGGSNGQLVDFNAQDKAFSGADKTAEASQALVSVTNTTSIARNMSSVSLNEKPSPSKASDRRSAHLPDAEESAASEDEKDHAQSSTGSVGRKFGLKNVIPAASFSTSSTQQHHTGAGPSTANAGGSVGASSHKRSGRRTVSIHQFDALWQDSGSKFLNFVHHAQHGDTSDTALGSTSKAIATGGSKEDDGKKSRTAEWDRGSIGSSFEKHIVEENMSVSSKSNRTSVSTILPHGESIALTTNAAAVNDKLPAGLGIFRSAEFLNLSSIPNDGNGVLAVWKNMLCSIGDINRIEDPHNYAVAMRCVVDIWNTLHWVRSRQPYRNVPMPALYEVTPWLLQATELSEEYDEGRAAAYGCLCRVMSQRPEQGIPFNYYAHFYKAILKGLSTEGNDIIESIMCNSERIFSLCLPGVYILIPSFIDAVEKQLLDSDNAREVSPDVKISCIKILGSLVSISNHLTEVRINMEGPDLTWIGGFSEKQFAFSDIKGWLKELLLRLVNASISVDCIEQEADAHCMLISAICTLALDELLACESPHTDLIHETLLAIMDHLYWSNIPIVNTAVDCLNALAQVYRGELDSGGNIMERVMTKVIDALNVHLRYYEQNSKDGRGFIISKLFSCLLEWLMVIDPMILSETELCPLVFDVIQYAIHISSEGDAEKLLPHPPVLRTNTSKKKELPFKFKLLTEKRPVLHHEYVSVLSGSDVSESDQGYVKESAEAVLLHLLHHFNNFAPPYGPATIHSTIVGPGVATDDKEDHPGYRYFAFNDTTIIAFVELPETETHGPQARVIVRDLTGRYVWDAQLEPKEHLTSPVDEAQRPGPAEDLLDKEQGFVLRSGISVRKTSEEQKSEAPQTSTADNNRLAELLEKTAESDPDSQIPLNKPSTLSPLQEAMVGRMGDQLNEFLLEEAENNKQQEFDARLWYSKMNVLRRKEATLERSDSLHTHLTANFSIRKDFLPAFPREAEKCHVPFQQSRLLLSHLGFINYEQLRDGSFQMLNKTPALYRDLRGLDRKQGRETMKIAVIYVGPGQEDEQVILHNDKGSPMYNAFVNSLGWEIDIATHTGYLGGLERNLTNGTRANYYCSSTLEMIFHDVTKMPTEADDPKQLKKKRHIGNDHVHIVWNEHDRDYRIGTIGGDFGNAQIIVNPLSNGLFAIRIHRDPKIPYFGPLFDRMVVSQATLGPLVRATAINAFRASVHNNYFSFYSSVFAQRANDVRTIAQRHKVATWSYEQFMEKIFMPSDE